MDHGNFIVRISDPVVTFYGLEREESKELLNGSVNGNTGRFK